MENSSATAGFTFSKCNRPGVQPGEFLAALANSPLQTTKEDAMKLTDEEIVTEFKRLKNDIDNQPPKTQEAILRIQDHLSMVLAEDAAEDQRRAAHRRKATAQQVEAAAKMLLDTALADLTQQASATSDQIELAEINLLAAKAKAAYRPAERELTDAAAAVSEAERHYAAAVDALAQFPLPGPDRG